MRPHIRALAFTGDLFRILWIYFPSFVLPLITLVVFLSLPQAYDLVGRYAESPKQAFAFYMVGSTWVYCTWYAARLIQYADVRRRKRLNTVRFSMLFTQRLYRQMPRLVGITCWMIIGLIMFGHERFPVSWCTAWAKVLLVAYLLFCFLVYRRFWKKALPRKAYRWRLYFLFLPLGVSYILGFGLWMGHAGVSSILVITFLWSLLQFASFSIYVNLRRQWIRHEVVRARSAPITGSGSNRWTIWIAAVQKRWRIAPWERQALGFYLVCFWLATTLYILNFTVFPVAVFVGPFAVVIVAFTVLGGFGSFLTILGIRYRLNLHLLAIGFALLLGKCTPNDHDIALVKVPEQNRFRQRPDLEIQLGHWMDRNEMLFADTGEVPMFFVLSDGGAIRSAYWSAGLMSKMEDRTQHRFSRQLFSISGASGGTVGNAVFYSLLYQHYVQQQALHHAFQETDTFLRSDFLSYPLATYAGADFLRHLIPLPGVHDRARALEIGFTWMHTSEYIRPVMDSTLGSLFLNPEAQKHLPVFFMNTTRCQDGRPGIISSVKLSYLPDDDRLDVLDEMERWSRCRCCRKEDGGVDIRLVTAAIMSSRFPFFSPAGCIGNHCFVDGGYFDNSGAGITMETMRRLQGIMDQETDSLLRSKYQRIRFYVLHFRNSAHEDGNPAKMHPLINGWFAPLIVSKSLWNAQTEINNNRLKSYLCAEGNNNWLEFTLIGKDEPDHPTINMNWAISYNHIDSMELRMDTTWVKPEFDRLIGLCR